MTDSAASEPLRPVLIRFPPAMYEQVRERAAADERTIAQTIRRAVRLYLEDGTAP